MLKLKASLFIGLMIDPKSVHSAAPNLRGNGDNNNHRELRLGDLFDGLFDSLFDVPLLNETLTNATSLINATESFDPNELFDIDPTEIINSLCPWCNNNNIEDTCSDVSPLNETQFDLDQFIEKSWFVQRQQIVPYQRRNQLYCVVATYDKQENNNNTFISVNNYGNNDGVNGFPQNSNAGMTGQLCAEQITGGSLQVAPCFFSFAFDWFAGPYWVLSVAEDYSWAIVSGGKPDQVRQTEPTTLCTTKEGSSVFDTNGSGLWLFTRDRVASNKTIVTMESTLLEMGVYTGDLIDVVQGGCFYEGAMLKE